MTAHEPECWLSDNSVCTDYSHTPTADGLKCSACGAWCCCEPVRVARAVNARQEALPAGYLPFDRLSDAGVLWYINRVAFHPRGFALAVLREADGSVSGWTIIGDGSEPWSFVGGEDGEHRAIEAMFAAARGDGGRPNG